MIGARVVTQSVVLPRPHTSRRRLRLSGSDGVKQRQPVERGSAAGWIARFDNDRDLTAIKVALIGAAVLIAMALEVPW